MRPQDAAFIARFAKADSLTEITPDADKILMNRFWLTDKFQCLPKFLRVINWSDPEERQEAYRLLDLWQPPPTPEMVGPPSRPPARQRGQTQAGLGRTQALELLDVAFPDYRVREYAVNLLKRMTDAELEVRPHGRFRASSRKSARSPCCCN